MQGARVCHHVIQDAVYRLAFEIVRFDRSFGGTLSQCTHSLTETLAHLTTRKIGFS